MTDDDQLLCEIAQDFETDDKVDPKVSNKLAEIVNNRWSSKLEENKVKEKQDKYYRPDNCDKLIAPRVNPEIWGRLNHSVKSSDLRLAGMQKTLVKVASAFVKSTNEILGIRANRVKTVQLPEKLGKIPGVPKKTVQCLI